VICSVRVTAAPDRGMAAAGTFAVSASSHQAAYQDSGGIGCGEAVGRPVVRRARSATTGRATAARPSSPSPSPGIERAGIHHDKAGQASAGVPRSSGCRPIGEQPDTPSGPSRARHRLHLAHHAGRMAQRQVMSAA